MHHTIFGVNCKASWLETRSLKY